jgi:tetratricopeptide (TPR) repeat protein
MLEVDPESLEAILLRTREAPDGPASEALAPDEWERLIQILKHQLGGFEEPEIRLLALEHVGEIYEHQLGDAQRALRWWAQALTGYPFVEVACAQLERLAALSDDWARVVQVYASAQKRVAAADVRHVQLCLARVYLEEQGDHQRAVRIYRSLWDKEHDLAALEALEQYYVGAGKQDEVVRLIRERVARAETVEERVGLLLRLGYLYEVELQQPDQAVECYRRVLRSEDRGNRQALEALEQIYLRRERWRDLLSIYERMVEDAQDDGQRVEYLVRMGRICDDALGDRTRSRKLWARVLELRGDDREVLFEMRRRFEAMERWEELAEVLGRLAAIEEDPEERAAIYERQGRVLGDRLEDPRRALESWRKVLEADPENVGGLLAISDHYGALGEWEELSKTLKHLLEVGTREGRGGAFLIGLHTQLARLEEGELGHPDEAVEAWRRVLELDPENRDALNGLESLLARENRWGECLEVLESQLRLARTDEERLELLMRRAGMLRDGLEDLDAAIDGYRLVLDLDPGNEEAQQVLGNILHQGERWEELVAQIFSRLESVGNRLQAVQLLQEAAVIYEEQLGQADKAFAVWQAALRQDLENDVTISNLDRLAAQLGRYEELLAGYQQGLQSTPSAPIKVVLLTAMARCYGLEMGQVDRAVSLLHEALHLDPEAIGALEVLAECYRRAGRSAELAPVLKRQADLERDGAAAVRLLKELGSLWSQLGDPGRAIKSFEKVVEIEPTHLGALGALEALYLACGMWQPLVDVLRRQLELYPDDAARFVEFKTRIGEIYDQQLGELERAMQSYREVLELEPDNVTAMRALVSLYDRTDQIEAYLEMVERLLGHSSTEERLEMYPKIAAAWEEQFKRPERAMAALEKLLEADPRSERSYVELARLCRQNDDPKRLADVLGRHADAVDDPGERVGLLLSLGETCDTELRDSQRAVEAFNRALELEAGATRALLALTKLHERQEDWPAAVAALERLAPLVSGTERADVLFRLGRIHEEELVRAEGRGEGPPRAGAERPTMLRAEQLYTEALAVDEGHFDSMTRLVAMRRDRGDWAEAAAMMIRAEGYTSNQAKRVQLLHEAGMIHLQHLEDEGRAVELLSRTLEVDPDHMASGLPLAEIYFREEKHELLEPVLDMLARKVDPRDRKTQHQVNYRLGRTAAALGKAEKAIRCFEAARLIDTTHLPTLKALAELQYRGEQWAEAFKLYQTILIHHRPSLSEPEVVEIFFRLGDIKRQQGEWRKALNYFEKGQEVDQSHRATLEGMVDVQERLANWKAVIEAKTALLAVVAPEERFELFLETADLMYQQLRDIKGAVENYHAAVALRPDDRVLLTKFVEVLTEAEAWEDVLQIVLRLAELEKNPEIRARFFRTAGVMCRDQLNQPDQAVHFFNEALDCAPGQLETFEAVDRLLTAAKDWPALERNYRRMIQRMPPDSDARLTAMLWHNLGEVYRSRLKRPQDAVAAFEEALRLETDNLQRRAILAELYELLGPVHAAKAIAQHRALIASNQDRIGSYHALVRLHLAQNDQDGAWCVCEALALVKQATEEERQLHERHRTRTPRRARGRFSEALWRECVLVPGQNTQIDALLAALAPLLIELMARPAKDFGLKKRQRIKPSAGSPLMEVFHHVSSVLGGLSAELYQAPEQKEPLLVANTTGSPTLVVNQMLLSSVDEKQLAFTLGQQLTYLRPAYFLCRLFPAPNQLRLLLAAVFKLVNPAANVPPDALELTAQLTQPFQSHPGLLQQLAELLRPLASSGTLDLTPWWNSISLAADRVGFILCDDLQVAAKVIQSEPTVFGTMPASDKVKRLVAYCVSPEYARVRRELGISVPV